MDLLKPYTLKKRLDSGMRAKEFLAIMQEVAKGVLYAHNAGIIHRDLKPENIIFDNNDTPVITDFGLSKCDKNKHNLTATGSILPGTILYMAPERLEGVSEAPVDVWALGIMLYEGVTGTNPLEAPTMGDSINKVLNFTLDPHPKLPKNLYNLCAEATKFSPDLRISLDLFCKKLSRILETFEEVVEFEEKPNEEFIDIESFEKSPTIVVPNRKFLTKVCEYLTDAVHHKLSKQKAFVLDMSNVESLETESLKELSKVKFLLEQAGKKLVIKSHENLNQTLTMHGFKAEIQKKGLRARIKPKGFPKTKEKCLEHNKKIIAVCTQCDSQLCKDCIKCFGIADTRFCSDACYNAFCEEMNIKGINESIKGTYNSSRDILTNIYRIAVVLIICGVIYFFLNLYKNSQAARYYVLGREDRTGTKGTKLPLSDRIEHLKTAVYYAPLPLYQCELAYAYSKGKQYSKAKELFLKILKKEPKNIEALFGVGLVTFRLGKENEAEKYLLKSLKIEGIKYFKACYMLGEIYFHNEEYEKAKMYLEYAKEKIGAKKLYLYLATIYKDKIPDMKKAIAVYRKLNSFRFSLKYQIELIKCYRANKNYSEIISGIVAILKYRNVPNTEPYEKELIQTYNILGYSSSKKLGLLSNIYRKYKKGKKGLSELLSNWQN